MTGEQLFAESFDHSVSDGALPDGWWGNFFILENLSNKDSYLLDFVLIN